LKRGASGLSFVVGVDKPQNMSSHDVVNRARRIFAEGRIGHTGTLDPQASGVLVLCVGSAARLNPYLQAQDKSYQFTVVFGSATDTDDAAGIVTKMAPIPQELYGEAFARDCVSRLVGKHNQLPPVYSAIKVGGERSYKAARAGKVLDLAAREIEVFEAHLLGVLGAPSRESLTWEIQVRVSKGTYIRSLARDLGEALACPSHVGNLRRTSVGVVGLKDCVSLETLEQEKQTAALDAAKLLGYRIAEVGKEHLKDIVDGKTLALNAIRALYACTQEEGAGGRGFSKAGESTKPFADDEIVSLVCEDRLYALIRYDEKREQLKPSCVFPQGVLRG